MSKTVLFEVFELLKSQGLVSTENEFSKDWLARSESYARGLRFHDAEPSIRSEEHTSELQSQSTISYAVFCLKKKKKKTHPTTIHKLYN